MSSNGTPPKISVTLYDGCVTHETNPGVHVDINSVVERIKLGQKQLPQKTEAVRALYSTDSDKYDAEKKKLVCVTWSGTFPPNERLGDKLIKHSGYVVLDIDDDIEIDAVREHLTAHPNVRFAFLSPSGRGYKPLIRVYPIPQNRAEHEAAFNAVLEVFSDYASDKELVKQRDPNRLCFLAYDPDPIQNNQAVPVEWEMPDTPPELSVSATKEMADKEHSPPTETEAIQVLRHIPNDTEYSRWVEIGMAIKDAKLPMSVFQEWTGGKRKTSKGKWIDVDIPAQWNRLNGSGITWGTVVHLSLEAQGKSPKKKKDKESDDDKLYPYDVAEAFMTNNRYWFTHEALHQYSAKTGLYEPCVPNLRKSTRKMFASSVSTSKVNEVENHITDMAHRSDLASDGVVFKNGVLDLDTMELSKHTPDSYHLRGFPVNYQTDGDVDIKVFRDYLYELTMDVDAVTTLLQMIGACFDGDVFEMQTAFLLTGSGSNGKSTLLDIIEEVVGVDNISRTPFTEYGKDRWAKGGLVDKSVALDDDIDPTLPLGPALKALITKRMHEAEFKYLDKFRFPLEATFIGAINGQPHTSDTTSAFWRRFLPLDFPMRFKKDAGKRKALMSEFTSPEMLDTIATMSIRQYMIAKEAGNFHRPAHSDALVAEFQENANHVITFVDESIERSPDLYESRKEVWSAYVQWANTNDVKAYGAKRFWGALRNMNFDLSRKVRINNRSDRVVYDMKLI